MGGGASTAVNDIDDIIACTYLVGQTLAAISFPDMYRLYDFHSKKVPPLASQMPVSYDAIDESGNGVRIYRLKQQKETQQQSFAAMANEKGEEKEASSLPEDVLKITIGQETIVIEAPNEPNEDGWTPLHACCHSIMMGSRGLAIIDWIMAHGGTASDFNIKTKRGPGSYNSGYTPLHMASAYGVEVVVGRLVAIGADCNTINALSWSPLNEACHRGFLAIMRHLVTGGADINYIPDENLCRSSPFLRAPAQSPLGEVSRCGFREATKFLLEAGAQKDQQNSIGWTPLHEACFFNQIDIVKLLLEHGANPLLRNNHGAGPYHLASFPTIRDLIRQMAGEAATVQVDIPPQDSLGIHDMSGGDEARPKKDIPESEQKHKSPPSSSSQEGHRRTMIEDRSSSKEMHDDENKEIDSTDDVKKGQESYLHRGGMLGDLPPLSPSKEFDEQSHASFGAAGDEEEEGRGADSKRERRRLKHQSSSNSSSRRHKAEGKDTSNVPQGFLCQICLRPMRHPMRTPYGNVYERDVIKAWFNKNGSLDPLTGQPLIYSQLQEDKELKAKIKEFWAVQKTKDMETIQQQNETSKGDRNGHGKQVSLSSTSTLISMGESDKVALTLSTPPALSNDSLYDF